MCVYANKYLSVTCNRFINCSTQQTVDIHRRSNRCCLALARNTALNSRVTCRCYSRLNTSQQYGIQDTILLHILCSRQLHIRTQFPEYNKYILVCVCFWACLFCRKYSIIVYDDEMRVCLYHPSCGSLERERGVILVCQYRL